MSAFKKPHWSFKGILLVVGLAVALVAATALALKAYWLGSILLTIGLVVLDKAITIGFSGKKSPNQIILFLCCIMLLIPGALGSAYENYTKHMAGHQTESSLDGENLLGADDSATFEKDTADVIEEIVPVDPGEIQTAVSFNTPSQIEAELKDDTVPFYPDVDQNELQTLLILQTGFRSEISDKGEYIEKIKGFLREHISGLMHMTPNCDASVMNSSAELATHLKAAEDLDKEIRKERTVGKYEALMAEYEAAYKIAKCSTISLQLARPYAEIVEIYPRNSSANCNTIFEYGIIGIRDFIETLTYETIYHEDDGDILYRIGQIYHYLGDIPRLDKDLRTELYLTAAAYLELANEYPADTYHGYTSYYAGMVYHKLGVISGDDNWFYLQRSLDRYNEALTQRATFSNTIIADDYKFQADVYERLANFVKMYGRNDFLESSSTYNKKAAELLEKAAALRS